MCCRMTLFKTLEEILKEVGPVQSDIDTDEDTPSYNIPPSSGVPVLWRSGGERVRLSRFHWGLSFHFGGQEKPLANLRVETLLGKPSFVARHSTGNCLVLCDGYYEWRREGGKKIPYHIHAPSFKLLTLAGVWREGHAEEAGSFLVVTKPARDDISFIHDRMPVLIAPDRRDEWLSCDGRKLTPEKVADYAAPLEFHEVSSFVNKVSNDSPTCVAPVERAVEQDVLPWQAPPSAR